MSGATRLSCGEIAAARSGPGCGAELAPGAFGHPDGRR
jgi:hypothetical protein